MNRLVIDKDKGELGKDKNKQITALFDFQYNRNIGYRKRRR